MQIFEESFDFLSHKQVHFGHGACIIEVDVQQDKAVVLATPGERGLNGFIEHNNASARIR